MLASVLAPLADPWTLQNSLMAQLDQLLAPIKEIAQIGATIGREFSFDLLEEVSPFGARRCRMRSMSWLRRVRSSATEPRPR